MHRGNTLFGMFFETVDADGALSPVDGALYTCSDLVAFIQCVIYLRGKAISDVALFRLSADSGQGDLKISCQLIFSDDSVFTATSRAQRGSGDILDASVKRTFVLSLMSGASETYASLSLMFGSLNLRGVKQVLPHATFVFPVDMKLVNIVVRPGPVGCSNPYLYTL